MFESNQELLSRETKRINQGLFNRTIELFTFYTFFPNPELAQKAQRYYKPTELAENPSAIQSTWKKMFTSSETNSDTDSENLNFLETKTFFDKFIEHMPSKTVFIHLRKQFYQIVGDYIRHKDREALATSLHDLQETVKLWEQNEVISLRQAKLCRDEFTADKIQNLLKH